MLKFAYKKIYMPDDIFHKKNVFKLIGASVSIILNVTSQLVVNILFTKHVGH